MPLPSELHHTAGHEHELRLLRHEKPRWRGDRSAPDGFYPIAMTKNNGLGDPRKSPATCRRCVDTPRLLYRRVLTQLMRVRSRRPRRAGIARYHALAPAPAGAVRGCARPGRRRRRPRDLRAPARAAAPDRPARLEAELAALRARRLRGPDPRSGLRARRGVRAACDAGRPPGHARAHHLGSARVRARPLPVPRRANGTSCTRSRSGKTSRRSGSRSSRRCSKPTWSSRASSAA